MANVKTSFLLGSNLFINMGSDGTLTFDVVDLYNNIDTGKYAFSQDEGGVRSTIDQEINLMGFSDVRIKE